MTIRFTAVIWREGERLRAFCPELDFRVDGDSIVLALENLRVVVANYLRSADPGDVIARGGADPTWITTFWITD